MSYLIAVATSDGEIIDTHFGHADSFLILEVDEDGNYEEIEERDVRSACGGGEDCVRCSGSIMNDVAENLKDVDFVLCARSGPHAEEVLRRYGIAILDVIMPIDKAVPKIHKFRERYRTNVLI
ncbi:NifB/NifX family molybdenum-iron cluster-binding protein [Butyrivibrio sp. VCD2006]|uniref:NifB/NifX family molybdenum-iron cluster-binding protein n=1 Tax=Butyrivibrio sp. VCD2006 TaxID=1280664 RepID=UPI0004261548|nr:NifB/NifX family molybdenum-iron cluster-binding protein [Butyrivibrio sp. VCD2006]